MFPQEESEAGARRAHLCSAFAKALLDGDRPAIEDHVAQVPESDRAALLQELVQKEYVHRWRHGELPTLVEYQARFPEHREAIERACFARPDEGGVPYALIEQLGAGGFGTVLRARDTELQRDVAVKVLNQDRLASTMALGLFEQEMRTLAGIEHDGVVRVYSQERFGNGQRFVVMQFVTGGSLRSLIASRPQGIEALQAARIMRDVAASLHRVHGCRGKGQPALIHCDLKPENILLDKTGKPHIADFGIAGLASDFHQHAISILGTRRYCAPEQIRGMQGRQTHLDTRSDIWSLGVILYELLTGKLPFVGSNDDVMEAIERYEPTAPKDLNTAVPAVLDVICRKCLRKDPNDRYQSGAELAEVLGQWLETAEKLPVPWDFSGFLQEKRAGFSDRPWLFDEVDAWLIHGNERVLLVTGDVGTGKSSFLSELIHRNADRRVLAFHCCQHDTPDTLRPECFVRSVAGMLAEKLDGFREQLSAAALELLSRARCESNAASAFEVGVIAPLNRLSRQQQEVAYIVIDALDESLGVREPGPTVADLLAARVQRLPSWVRIVATTRRDLEIMQRFSGVRVLAIDRENEHHANEIEDDLQRFLVARLSEPNLLERLVHARLAPHEASRTLLEKSEGNFLYLTQAVQGIERGIYSFDRLDELPPGLDALFRGFFGRDFMHKQDFVAPRAILEVVLAAEEPLTENLIAAATSRDTAYELPELLRKLAVYLPPRQVGQSVRYHFVHSWLARWLSDPGRAGKFFVSAANGHKRLADVCAGWRTLPKGGARFYALRFADHHLASTGQTGQVVRLLTDPDYLEACVEVACLQLGPEDDLYRLALDEPALTTGLVGQLGLRAYPINPAQR
jgi:serine/threonine protein kinase